MKFITGYCDTIIKKQRRWVISYVQKHSYYTNTNTHTRKGLFNGPLENQFNLRPFLLCTQYPIYICNERELVITDVIGIETQYEGGPAYKLDINTIALFVPSRRQRKKKQYN